MIKASDIGSYTAATLKRGEYYQPSQFDRKIDGNVFVRPCGSRVVTDSEHVIIDVLLAPEDIVIPSERTAWAAFIFIFFILMSAVWLAVMICYALGWHR